MFGRKKAVQTLWRQEGKIPVIRASICTGEKVAGFREGDSCKFEDMMLIKGEKDLKRFMDTYGIKEGEIQKEW